MYMKKICLKHISVVLTLFVVLTLLASCSGQDTAESVDDPGRPIEIGLTFDSLVIERWERDRDVFVSTAKDLGVEVNVQNANGDVNTQISQIEYFIQKKVKAIVVVATDCSSLSDVIAKAHRAGIKVISYDRLIENANTDLFVSFDNNKVGELMAEGIVSQTGGNGDILMVCGPLTDSNVPSVIQGFEEGIEGTELNTVKVWHCAGWKPEYAFDYVSTYLNENPDAPPAAIMCGNDSIAGQTIRALSEKKLAGEITVTGQDAELEACQRIVEGTQYMTVYKPVEKLAQRAAVLTVDLIKNGKADTEDTISDGTYNVPYESLDPIMVTSDNMDEVIIGTFHQKGEVYLNVKEE